MRYHYISVRISKIKKKKKTDNVNCIEQQSHLFIAGENKSQAQALWKLVVGVASSFGKYSSYCIFSYILQILKWVWGFISFNVVSYHNYNYVIFYLSFCTWLEILFWGKSKHLDGITLIFIFMTGITWD